MSVKIHKLDNDSADEKRFKLLVSGISDYAIYMLDPDGYINSWNAGAERFKGYVAEEIVGKHFSHFYTPEDRAAGTPEKALRIARDQGKFEAEGWRVRKDGSRFWAHVVIDPIRNQSGNLVGFAKITRDITERKLAQEALEESEQRFRLLVQGVTDYAIYMLSPNGEVTNWNSGAERIKGYTEDEVVGTHFSRFYTPEDQVKKIPAHALATAANEGRFEQEGWRVRKDGTRFMAHVVIDAIRDESGRLVGFAKITRDITEKQKAAAALELANAALFQSQKMEAIGQLTGGVAHDFNNLLSVVASGLDILSMRLHGDKEVKLIEGMHRAVTRGATLTQQLLSFARRQPLKEQKENVNRLLANFEPVLRRAGNSSIAFKFMLAPDLRMISIDAARLEATVLNLVVNGRDAMPRGGTLTLATENVELVEHHKIGKLTAGAYIKISVADTGEGMTPDVAAKVFEPFFTTKEPGKGTGLGLSQVYGFIAQSGGEVTVETEAGKGSVFNLYLPAVDEALDAPVQDQHSDTDTVLIVEDEPDVLEVTAELFRSLGYEVRSAGNANDALDILKRTPDIDILFTDVMMPNGMSGIELAKLTRTLYPTIKIMLASGYPLPAIKTEHGDLDDFSFMNKPYRLSELAKKLRMTG